MLYRVRQFWNAITSAPNHDLLADAEKVLTPRLMQLFLQMQPVEQKHCLQVYQKLCAVGVTNQDLLIAALLHDVGKIKYPLHLWERVEIVLIEKLIPKKVQTWGGSKPTGWRKPFVVAKNHPNWGADLAEQAGASKVSVCLIRRHHDKTLPDENVYNNVETQLLRQLQIYDNES